MDNSPFQSKCYIHLPPLQASGALVPPAAPTMPDEDFFSLICRLQGGRIDDQRCALPRENGGQGARQSDI